MSLETFHGLGDKGMDAWFLEKRYSWTKTYLSTVEFERWYRIEGFRIE